MIGGAHVVIYTKDAEADRAFFRDVLGFPSVDAGHGWLIFALPPAEAAFHPAENNGRSDLYLMCDDLGSEIAALRKGRRLLRAAHRALGLGHADPAPRRRLSRPLSAFAPSGRRSAAPLKSPLRAPVSGAPIAPA